MDSQYAQLFKKILDILNFEVDTQIMAEDFERLVFLDASMKTIFKNPNDNWDPMILAIKSDPRNYNQIIQGFEKSILVEDFLYEVSISFEETLLNYLEKFKDRITPEQMDAIDKYLEELNTEVQQKYANPQAQDTTTQVQTEPQPTFQQQQIPAPVAQPQQNIVQPTQTTYQTQPAPIQNTPQAQAIQQTQPIQQQNNAALAPLENPFNNLQPAQQAINTPNQNLVDPNSHLENV